MNNLELFGSLDDEYDGLSDEGRRETEELNDLLDVVRRRNERAARKMRGQAANYKMKRDKDSRYRKYDLVEWE